MQGIQMTIILIRLSVPNLEYATWLMMTVLVYFLFFSCFSIFILGYIVSFFSSYCHPPLKKRNICPFIQSQKKRVTEEENASKKRGLGIRLLPATEQDSATAKSVKFSAKFDKNRKDKRALISSESIFSGVSSYSMSDKRKRELESKRRKICATSASNLLAGRVKPSSWSQSSTKQKGTMRR